MFCGPILLLPNPRPHHRFHISLHLVYRPLPYGPTSPGGSLCPSRVDPGPRPLHTLERYYPCMDWWPGEIAGVYSYTLWEVPTASYLFQKCCPAYIAALPLVFGAYTSSPARVPVPKTPYIPTSLT